MKLFCITDQIKLQKKKYVEDYKLVLNSEKFILNKNVFKIENTLKNFVGSKYCISTSSGTDALLISLMAYGISKGDEVITTAFTYVSTVEVILRLGAKPVFVDIKKENGLIDEGQIEKKITKRTKAIIPVSLFGLIPEFKIINKIARQKKILVIEDGAQSFGSKKENKMSCNQSNIGCTSFYPTKNLSSFGDGGAIFTNNKSLAKKCILIRNHGESKRYFSKITGICGRLDEIQASVLLRKFKKFNFETKKRIHNGKRLKKIFVNNSLMSANKDSIAYNTFPIIVENRKRIIKKIKAQKIQYACYYPIPIHKQPIIKNKYIKLPVTEYYSKRIVNLPCHPYLNEKYFLKVKKILNEG